MKTIVRSALVCVMVGATSSILLAWSCALLSPNPPQTSDVWREELEIWWSTHCPIDGVASPAHDEYGQYRSRECGFPNVHRNAMHTYESFGFEVVRIWSNASSKEVTATRLRAGWPVLAFEGSQWQDQRRGTFGFGLSTALMISLPRQPSVPYELGLLNNYRVLAFGPLWGGVFANAALFSVGLWLLIPLPCTLFTQRRIWNKRCPACAYPWGVSSICTECGHDLSKWMKTTERPMA